MTLKGSVRLPRVVKVIESEIIRGAGLQKGQIKYQGGCAEHKLLEDDLARMVTQYHTLEGEFLAEVDSRTEMIMKDFNNREQYPKKKTEVISN